jgi:hypothetical protein
MFLGTNVIRKATGFTTVHGHVRCSEIYHRFRPENCRGEDNRITFEGVYGWMARDNSDLFLTDKAAAVTLSRLSGSALFVKLGLVRIDGSSLRGG